MKIITKEVQLNAFSLTMYNLPTFSKGYIRTLKTKWYLKDIKWLIFTEVIFKKGDIFEYRKNYCRI